MMRVPEFLLRRLYVKGSLKNTSDGFEFELRNSLGSGYARKMLPVTVDGAEIPLGSCFFKIDGIEVPFEDVSVEKPFTLAMNRTIVINVRSGSRLSTGARKIGMGFEVAGLGALRFHFIDVAAE